MKKFTVALFGFLLLSLAGCGASSTQTNEVAEVEEVAEEPVYLELRFGNGETLRKEVDYIEIPDSLVSKWYS